MARSYPTAVRSNSASGSSGMECHLPGCWNLRVFDRTLLSDLHLAEKDARCLASFGYRDALCNWPNDGNVPIRFRYDRVEHCGIRAWIVLGSAIEAPRTAGKIEIRG